MRLKWSIAVAGTHGKTTTTSLIGALLDAAQLDPTVINGGIINAYGTNARLGAGDWMVVEADESDGTFVKLPATIAVVTNIDPEHLDFYGTFEALQQAFESFVANIPFYGFAALCIDHPVVQGMIPRALRAAHRDLRLEPAGRYPRRQRRDRAATARATTSSSPTGASEREPHHRRPAPADVRPAQRAELAGRDRRRRGDGPRRRRRCARRSPASRACKRRFTKTGECERRHGHRRLRPSSGRDRRRAARRPRRDLGQRHRRGAAASLHAASPISSPSSAPASTTPTRCWSPTSMPPARRRSRASTATRWSRACARAATATCWPLASPAELAPLIARPAEARRFRRLPRRRLDHATGRRACPAELDRLRRRSEERGMMAAERRSAPPHRPAAAGARPAQPRTRRSRPSPGSASAARPRSCSAPPIVDDLAAFLAAQARRCAGDRDRRRLEPAGARRRRSGRRGAARPRLRRDRDRGRARCAPAPARSTSTSRSPPRGRASPASNSCAAFPARSAAGCA